MTRRPTLPSSTFPPPLPPLGATTLYRLAPSAPSPTMPPSPPTYPLSSTLATSVVPAASASASKVKSEISESFLLFVFVHRINTWNVDQSINLLPSNVTLHSALPHSNTIIYIEFMKI